MLILVNINFTTCCDVFTCGACRGCPGYANFRAALGGLSVRRRCLICFCLICAQSTWYGSNHEIRPKPAVQKKHLSLVWLRDTLCRGHRADGHGVVVQCLWVMGCKGQSAILSPSMGTGKLVVHVSICHFFHKHASCPQISKTGRPLSISQILWTKAGGRLNQEDEGVVFTDSLWTADNSSLESFRFW